MRFYDTNALLDLQEEAFCEDFYISSVTLKELERIKTSGNKDPAVKYAARKVVHLLEENEDKYHVIIESSNIASVLAEKKLEDTPDNRICACAALVPDAIFVTSDLCCRLIALNIFGLKTENIANIAREVYKGYRKITGSSEEINVYMNNLNLSDWNINEYLIIENIDEKSVSEMRFDGTKFVALRLPSSKFIKAKNSLQRCALDILLNPEITVAAILGGYGSGKTYMTMRMAVYHVTEKGNQSKILGIRELRGEGEEAGFLPGDLDMKTKNFFLPLAQQLDGGEFELENLKMKGILESNIPYYMKGTTYNNTIILVDEAEDFNEKQIRLIGTRLGENSKIYFSGDYKQSVLNNTEDNALVKMCREFKGNPKFGCIYLGEDVRSTTSKMFADLFQK